MKHTIEIEGLPGGYEVKNIRVTENKPWDNGSIAALIYVKRKQRRNLHDPMRFAEGLIEQLPDDHEGAINWLMNNGDGDKADNLRKKYNQSCPRRIVLEETEEDFNIKVQQEFYGRSVELLMRSHKIWRIVEDSGENND